MSKISIFVFLCGGTLGFFAAWFWSRSVDCEHDERVQEIENLREINAKLSQDLKKRKADLGPTQELPKSVEQDYVTGLEKELLVLRQRLESEADERRRLVEQVALLNEERIQDRESHKFLCARLGLYYWRHFENTPLHGELDSRQREIILNIYKNLGEPLTQDQIKELVGYLPDYYDRLQDWNVRYSQAQLEVGGDREHPTIQALLEERDQFVYERDERLFEIFRNKAHARIALGSR